MIPNDVERIEVVRITAKFPEELLACVALERRESELRFPVPLENKRDPPVAQPANAVVQKKVGSGGLRMRLNHDNYK
jgi:hypothetical protein